MKAQMGSRGVAILSLTSAADRGELLMPRPTVLFLEVGYGGLSGPQNRSGRVRKISPPLRFDPRTANP
jgi:hypothetical protein